MRERSAASIKLVQREMEALANANPELAANLKAVGLPGYRDDCQFQKQLPDASERYDLRARLLEWWSNE